MRPKPRAKRAADRQVGELFLKGLTDPKSLDPVDRTRFSWLISSIVTAQNTAYQDLELGVLTSADMSDLSESMSGILDTPGGRWFWRRNRGSFLPGFVGEVERTFRMGQGEERGTSQ